MAWSRHYAALLKYGEEHGDCNVPQKTVYECVLPGLGEGGTDYEYKGRLGQWLTVQRGSHRGTSKQKLTPKREALLQALVDRGKRGSI